MFQSCYPIPASLFSYRHYVPISLPYSYLPVSLWPPCPNLTTLFLPSCPRFMQSIFKF
uniref:Uncharacterized protein n=1 Tax=Physcomitrium patens TaxID=3218 RepID=A0A2K1IUF4_PHYPA|nr:hypothetical protein PHYPA_024848 [Physcomitrium patens]